MTTRKINGWWWLWIFLSALWLLAVGGVTYGSWPTSDEAAHHPAFIYQLTPEERAMLAGEDKAHAGISVQMPNGYLLTFKEGLSEEVIAPVARAYQAVTVKAQAQARKEKAVTAALIAALPPIFLAVFGAGVAWVRRGFAGQA